MPKESRVPEPTESELLILQVLWRKGPSSVRRVWSELGEKSGYTTVLKFLQIMLEKKLVLRDDRAHSHVYRAAIAETHAQDRALSRMIDNVFRGSTSELVLRALSAKPISTEERRILRTFLDDKDAEEK